MKFKTIIHQTGNNTGIIVPDEIIEKLNAGKKPPVQVTINNKYNYRNTVAVMGGKFMISLSAEHRSKANIKGGDEVMINIELDEAPRITEVPADLQKALDKNASAKKFYATLPPSSKKKYVLLVESAKTDETRLRRIEKVIADLVAGKK